MVEQQCTIDVGFTFFAFFLVGMTLMLLPFDPSTSRRSTPLRHSHSRLLPSCVEYILVGLAVYGAVSTFVKTSISWLSVSSGASLLSYTCGQRQILTRASAFASAPPKKTTRIRSHQISDAPQDLAAQDAHATLAGCESHLTTGLVSMAYVPIVRDTFSAGTMARASFVMNFVSLIMRHRPDVPYGARSTA